jgi:hypothetical protein
MIPGAIARPPTSGALDLALAETDARLVAVGGAAVACPARARASEEAAARLTVVVLVLVVVAVAEERVGDRPARRDDEQPNDARRHNDVPNSNAHRPPLPEKRSPSPRRV